MQKAGALLVLMAMVVYLAGDAEAKGVVNGRQDKQENRIEQGVKSGELTKKETAKLIRGQKKVNRIEQKVKSDGTLTAKEKARLMHAQNVQSKKIYNQKHDNQDRD